MKLENFSSIILLANDHILNYFGSLIVLLMLGKFKNNLILRVYLKSFLFSPYAYIYSLNRAYNLAAEDATTISFSVYLRIVSICIC